MENMPSTATVSRRIEWVDTDASGHQHNSIVLKYVEAAERALIEPTGLLKEYFYSAPRVRHEVDYSGKLYFGQEVTTTITVEKLGRSSLTYSFEVWGEAFGDVPRRRAASGRMVVAHVAHGTEKSSPWPPTIVAALVPRHRKKTEPKEETA